jgi:CO/xanthine dehydrogenase FAD-binding subunit
MLPRFSYVTANTIEDALERWARSPAAAFFAGGTDLLPQLRLGRRIHETLIDVKRVSALGEIRVGDDDTVSIGAAVSLAETGRHPAVAGRYPLLAECCRRVGAAPLQNRATLAGNICNASPAADTAVALLALDALIGVAGLRGRRQVPIAEFFRGPGQTALVPGELVTEVVLPAAAQGFCGSYLRLSRRHGMDLATVGVLVGCANGDVAARYRVALAAVAPTPLRVHAAEALLEAEGPAAAARAAEVARAAAAPISDIRGSAEYRREMVGVLVERGVAALVERGVERGAR